MKKYARSTGGMKLIGKNRSSSTKRHSVIFSLINPTLIGMELNPDLCSERVINHPTHGTWAAGTW
jgi:hypothetical protein